MPPQELCYAELRLMPHAQVKVWKLKMPSVGFRLTIWPGYCWIVLTLTRMTSSLSWIGARLNLAIVSCCYRMTSHESIGLTQFANQALFHCQEMHRKRQS